jgi:hypothetical protein
MRGDWHRSIEALERAEKISREQRAAVEGRAYRLAHLAEAWLGAGEADRALTIAEEASRAAAEQGGPVAVIPAGLAMARVLLAAPDPVDPERIERELGAVLELVQRIEARGYEPQVRAELAELARRLGDTERHERELDEARRMFIEIGAERRAAALEGAAEVRQ